MSKTLIESIETNLKEEAKSMIEEQKEEAIARMEMIKLSRNCINAFKSGKVWESENYGSLYEVNEEEQKIIDDFERKYNGLVYHMIHNIFEFGECWSIFYVSDDKDEWKHDRADLEDGYAMVYVYNKDNDMFSEFGSIAFKPNIGGLVRLS